MGGVSVSQWRNAFRRKSSSHSGSPFFCEIRRTTSSFRPAGIRSVSMSEVNPYLYSYAALNSAVFSDGSFVYIPKGVRCPMELSTYFRINSAGTGQFERTLIVADEGYAEAVERVDKLRVYLVEALGAFFFLGRGIVAYCLSTYTLP